MNFTPLADRVVVQPEKLPDEIKTESGLFVKPEDHTRQIRGLVLSIGSDVKDINQGDYVLFSKVDGQKTTIEGIDVTILRDKMIWGVITL